MSQHMFSVSRNKPSRVNARKIENIAKRNECDFVEYVDPGDGYKNWFAGPNRGAPFDDAMARAVMGDLRAAGLADESGIIAAAKRAA
jgi:hypothetical protein